MTQDAELEQRKYNILRDGTATDSYIYKHLVFLSISTQLA